MQLTFDLGPFFDVHSTDVENSYALKANLNYLVQLNLAYLRCAQTAVPRLYDSGVRYGRTQVWDSIPALYKRGFGDCKSLTCALVAEYMVQGIRCEPTFRFNPGNDKGGNDYHILVMVPGANGYERKVFEDPSKKLGMGLNEWAHFKRSK